MKKLFVSILFLIFVVPVFSLALEANYLGLGKVNGFNVGICTNSEIFNISTGIYFDEHKVKYREQEEVWENGQYYRLPERKYDKKDYCIGPYVNLDWSILPIKFSPDFKLGLNFGVQVAATKSKVEGLEFPFSPSVSLQVRVKKLDAFVGVKSIVYPAAFFFDSNKPDKKLGLTARIGLRYTFKLKKASSGVTTVQKKNRTKIINGSNLRPSL